LKSPDWQVSLEEPTSRVGNVWWFGITEYDWDDLCTGKGSRFCQKVVLEIRHIDHVRCCEEKHGSGVMVKGLHGL